MSLLTLTSIIFSSLLLVSSDAQAAPRIAVLDFELNDITSLANTVREQQRTASIRPLLEQALKEKGNYEIRSINRADQAAANPGFGYLFRFSDLAAKLGGRFDADWIIVGQHSKPSHLFSYLLVHLIDVKTQALVADYAIELKGNSEEVTRRGVRSLADSIQVSIGQ